MTNIAKFYEQAMQRGLRSDQMSPNRVRVLDDAERTFEFSVASETPVMRWGCQEILNMDGCNLARLAAGTAPILRDHWSGDHVGVILSARVDEDRVLRAVGKISKFAARADETWGMIVEGTLVNTSVGAMILEEPIRSVTPTGQIVYTINKWEPYECSLVAAGADHSVGVGRSLKQRPQARNEEMKPETIEQSTPYAAVIADAETTRRREIQILAEAVAPGLGLPAAPLVTRAILSGQSVEDFRKELLALTERQAEPATPQSAPLRLTEREDREYSIVRALNNAQNSRRDGFEWEVSEEIRKRTGHAGQGLLIPTTLKTTRNPRVMRSFPNEFAASRVTERALTSTGAGTGAEVVFEQPGEFIDLLRNQMRVFQLGAQFLTGLSGVIEFPRQTAPATASWRGENPGSDTTATDPNMDQPKLSPKQLQARVEYSKTLLAIASYDVEMMVRNDLAAVHALAIDRAAIAGTGTGGQPQGIIGATGVAVVALGTDGAVPSWNNIIALETGVALANGDVATMNYLTTPGMRGLLKGIQKFSGTNGVPIWEGTEMNGYGAFVSNQVPSNLAKGASGNVCHAILFGCWNELVVGEFGVFELLVNPYLKSGQGMVVVDTFQLADVMIRRPACFARIVDAKLS